MHSLRERRASVVIAGVLLVLAALILWGLIAAARSDPEPRPWLGRWLGFGMVAVSLALGGSILWIGKPGQTHYWGLVGALAMAALLTGAYARKPGTPQASQQAEKIAMTVDVGRWRWEGDTIHEDPVKRKQTEDVLKTSDMIMRAYRRVFEDGSSLPEDVVNLAVIFAMGSRKVAHPPEQCYASKGLEFQEIAADSFQTWDDRTVAGVRLIFTESEGAQAAFYWYKAGDLNTGSFLRQQFHVILSNLLMRTRTRVALIRLSTRMKNVGEKEEAMARIKDFARDIFPEIEAKLR